MKISCSGSKGKFIYSVANGRNNNSNANHSSGASDQEEGWHVFGDEFEPSHVQSDWNVAVGHRQSPAIGLNGLKGCDSMINHQSTDSSALLINLY